MALSCRGGGGGRRYRGQKIKLRRPLDPRPAGVPLALLGDKFDAATAASLGIVNSVVPGATVYEYAEAKARVLASKAPEALRLSKRLMKQYDREQLKQIMLEEAVHFASRLGSPETSEAIQAFFEKREPDFSRFS